MNIKKKKSYFTRNVKYLHDKNVARGNLFQVSLVNTIKVKNIRIAFGLRSRLSLKNLHIRTLYSLVKVY